MVHPRGIAAERPWTWTVVEAVDRRLGLDVESEHLPLLDDGLVEEVVVAVQHDGAPSASFARPTPVMWSRWACVKQDVADRELVPRHRREQQIDVVAGVDDDAFPCFFAA